MDADRLNALLIDPSLGNRDDYMEIKRLAETYPYAQFLKILLAKLAQLLNEEDQVKMLHSAAIFSADRKILKKYYTGEHYRIVIPPEETNLHESMVIFPGPEEPGNPEIEPEAPAPGETGPDEDKDDIRDELKTNLDKLKHLQEEALGSTDRMKSEEPSAGSGQPDRETEPPGAPQEQSEDSPPGQDQKKLIEDFISSLNKVKSKTLLPPGPEKSVEDLSSESIEFDSNLVTETLAKLYVKQGKTEKAIEIYRKLIWKFPQKKAYFAARIEELNG